MNTQTTACTMSITASSAMNAYHRDQQDAEDSEHDRSDEETVELDCHAMWNLYFHDHHH